MFCPSASGSFYLHGIPKPCSKDPPPERRLVRLHNTAALLQCCAVTGLWPRAQHLVILRSLPPASGDLRCFGNKPQQRNHLTGIAKVPIAAALNAGIYLAFFWASLRGSAHNLFNLGRRSQSNSKVICSLI